MPDTEHTEHSVARMLQRADSQTIYTWTPDIELAVSRGGARRQRARVAARTTGAAVAAAVVVTATAVVGAGLGTGDTVIAAEIDDVPLTVSALQDSVPVDQLGADPVRLLQESGLALQQTGLEGVLVYDEQDYPALEVWLLSTGDGELCVVKWSMHYSGGGGGECTPSSQMLTEGVVSVGGWPDDQNHNMVVVLPDGYTTARVGGETFDVENNVAVIWTEAVPQGALEVDGPGVPAVRWPTTDFWGPPGTW